MNMAKMALCYHFSYVISHFCHWSWPNLGRETLHVFFLPETTIWTNLKWSSCSWGKQPSWSNTMKAIPSNPPANNKYTSESGPDHPSSAWTSLHSQVIDSWEIINGDCFKSLSFGAICYRVIVNKYKHWYLVFITVLKQYYAYWIIKTSIWSLQSECYDLNSVSLAFCGKYTPIFSD